MTQPEEFDLVILGGVGATRIPAARFRRFQYRRANNPQYLAKSGRDHFALAARASSLQVISLIFC